MSETILVLGGDSRTVAPLAGWLGGDSKNWSGTLWCRAHSPDPRLIVRETASCTDVCDVLLLASEWTPEHFRKVTARLAAVERLVFVLPALNSDWFCLGLLHAARQGRDLPMAVVVPEGGVKGLNVLPAVLKNASLISDNMELVSAWARGQLFQNMLPTDKAWQRKDH